MGSGLHHGKMLHSREMVQVRGTCQPRCSRFSPPFLPSKQIAAPCALLNSRHPIATFIRTHRSRIDAAILHKPSGLESNRQRDSRSQVGTTSVRWQGTCPGAKGRGLRARKEEHAILGKVTRSMARHSTQPSESRPVITAANVTRHGGAEIGHQKSAPAGLWNAWKCHHLQEIQQLIVVQPNTQHTR